MNGSHDCPLCPVTFSRLQSTSVGYWCLGYNRTGLLSPVTFLHRQSLFHQDWSLCLRTITGFARRPLKLTFLDSSAWNEALPSLLNRLGNIRQTSRVVVVVINPKDGIKEKIEKGLFSQLSSRRVSDYEHSDRGAIYNTKPYFTIMSLLIML